MWGEGRKVWRGRDPDVAAPPSNPQNIDGFCLPSSVPNILPAHYQMVQITCQTDTSQQHWRRSHQCLV